MEPDLPRQVTDQDSQPALAIADLRLRRDAGPVLVAFGRPVSPQDTAAAGWVHQGSLEALGGLRRRDARKKGDPDRPSTVVEPQALSDWRRLPGEILETIFSWLPLDDQAQCARVCHIWYRFVPQDRKRLATWLARCGPFRRRLQYALAAACKVRAYPFLQACAPDSLRYVRRQEGSVWLPGSLFHGLHDQISRANRCQLLPAFDQPLELDAGVVQPIFSPCGRDLALCDENLVASVHKMFSCRSQGRWQQEFDIGENLSCLLFDTLPDSCFFSGYPDGGVWYWEPCSEEDAADVRGVRMGDTPEQSFVFRLFLTPGARYLVALSRHEHDGGADFLTLFERISAVPRRQHWQWIRGGCYRNPRYHLVDMAVSPSRQQLVLAYAAPHRAALSHSLSLRWLQADQGGGECSWRSGRFDMPPGVVLRILYSPDGHWLFVARADGTASVWRVIDDRLEPQVTVSCHVHDGWGLVSRPVTIYNRGDLYGRWQPFSGDSSQLAVPVSPVAVQMWRCQEGQWTQQETVALAASEPESADQTPEGEPGQADRSGQDMARYTLLSDNGRVLVLASLRRLTLWYRQEPCAWQPGLAYEQDSPGRGLPDFDALLLGACSTHCLVATGPVLALYGPDNEDQFRCKARTETGQPIRRLVSTPDGLSFTTQEAGSPKAMLWNLRLCAGLSPP